MSNTELTEANFHEMQIVVSRHVQLMHTYELEGARVQFREVPNGLAASEYESVWSEYNSGLFNTLCLIIRYQKSLMAWRDLLLSISSEIESNIRIDYVNPVLRTACDLPSTFKDQMIRAVVKLYALKHPKDSQASKVLKQWDEFRDWYSKAKYFSGVDASFKEMLDSLNVKLHESSQAKALEMIHGRTIHDVFTNLVDGNCHTVHFDTGIVLGVYEEPVNLQEAIDNIDALRSSMQELYPIFNVFAGNLNLMNCGT